MQDNLLRRSLPHAVVRLFRMVNREHGRALKALGLSAEQAHILTVLWISGPQTVGELGRALALSSPTLTGALDRMEAQKLIRRLPDAADRRATVIQSLASPLLRDRALASLGRTSVICFEALSRTERDELLRLIQKCTDAIDAAADAGPPRRAKAATRPLRRRGSR
jgi:DNA-binding MarR family transcriptional regulator